MMVFDLDGTLSLVGDRIKLLQQAKKDWDAFYEACDQDEPNKPVIRLCRHLQTHGIVKIVTGRRESVRDKTMDWLEKHGVNIPPEHLHMRKQGDYRHDTVVKPELVENFISKIDIVFEDRNSMVSKWRELGLCCCQVAEGDF